MYKLVIKNKDLNATIIDENKNKKKINCSIEIFNINDKVFNDFLDYFFKVNNYDLSYIVVYFQLIFGIPKFNVKYTDEYYSYNNNYNKYNITSVPTDLELKNINKKIKQTLKKELNIVTTYYCENEKDITIACLFHFLKSGKKLNKCECCGKYFITSTKSSEKYCSRINNNKTCKLIMKNKKQSIKENNDPAFQLYKRVYNKLRMRKERTIDDDIRNSIDKMQVKLKKEYSIWEKKLKNNQVSFEEYEDWIKSFQ